MPILVNSDKTVYPTGPGMGDDEYLNGVQAAAYLGVSKQRIYELRAASRIGRLVGGYWLFTKTELDDYKATKESRKAGRPKGSRTRKKP